MIWYIVCYICDMIWYDMIYMIWYIWYDTITIWWHKIWFFILGRCGPTRVMASSFLKFLDHTQWHVTVGRTPLDDWSARRRDLYLTTHIHSQRTDIYAPGGIRSHNLSRRVAADLSLRPRGHWERHIWYDIWYDNMWYMIYDMTYELILHDIYSIWYIW